LLVVVALVVYLNVCLLLCLIVEYHESDY